MFPSFISSNIFQTDSCNIKCNKNIGIIVASLNILSTYINGNIPPNMYKSSLFFILLLYREQRWDLKILLASVNKNE